MGSQSFFVISTWYDTWCWQKYFLKKGSWWVSSSRSSLLNINLIWRSLHWNLINLDYFGKAVQIGWLKLIKLTFVFSMLLVSKCSNYILILFSYKHVIVDNLYGFSYPMVKFDSQTPLHEPLLICWNCFCCKACIWVARFGHIVSNVLTIYWVFNYVKIV